MANTIKISSLASTDYSNIAKLFNGEVGKTYSLSRLSQIESVNGRNVLLQDKPGPSQKYSVTYDRAFLYLGMKEPTAKQVNFGLLQFDKKEEYGNILFNGNKPLTASFAFKVENSKSNRMVGASKFSKLVLEMDYTYNAAVNMESKTMTEQMDIRVKSAKAVDA